MAIVETNWEKLLSPDSQIPPDVFFLVKGEDEGNESSNKPIGAHRIFLGGVSPVFMGMFFGPMKDTREVIEVEGTTHEAFTTMIDWVYKAPGSLLFAAPEREDEDYGNYRRNYGNNRRNYRNYEEDDEDDEDDEEEDALNQDKIRCPQKFFDLLDLAERYQILSLKRALTSNVLGTLAIKDNNVILAATVAKRYQGMLPFDEISTKMLAKCLKFLLKKKAGDLWAQFWALVNNSEKSLKERLAGTPFVNLTVPISNPIKHTLDGVGRTSYENCLYLACSGVHVR